MLAKLEFLATVGDGEKLNVHSMSVSGSDWKSKIWRAFFLWGEGKETTVNFIRETLSKATKLRIEYSNKKGKFFEDLASELKTGIENARHGVDILVVTYRDRYFSAQIKAIYKTHNLKLDVFEKIKNSSTEDDEYL